MLSKYRYPLSYVGAMTKIFGKVQKLVPHFGRRQAYSEWGRSAEGEEGVSYSHVRGWQLIFFCEHDATFERAPSDEKPIRSVLEHDE